MKWYLNLKIKRNGIVETLPYNDFLFYKNDYFVTVECEISKAYLRMDFTSDYE